MIRSFRTLQEHHFIRQGFSNDFAHWSLSACPEPILAEQPASVDVLWSATGASYDGGGNRTDRFFSELTS
jgi:hypothetical protein